ncbi:hypothetical protein SMC26_17345 [Actinomadura fulvescens]
MRKLVTVAVSAAVLGGVTTAGGTAAATATPAQESPKPSATAPGVTAVGGIYGTVISGPMTAPTAKAQAGWSGCRYASSAIAGASIKGKLCWDWGEGISVKGSVTDSARDGKYAMFRIHWRWSRTPFPGWQTQTKFIRTTKGKKAPITRRFYWDQPDGKVKDFWIQVCKQGSGKRTCDSRWH